MKTKFIQDENIKYFREFVWCLEKINVYHVKFKTGNHTAKFKRENYPIVFQTEQLVYKDRLTQFLNDTVNTKIILDYSVINKSILSKHNKTVILCPIFYMKEFVFPPQPKEYDFVMTGYFTPRRMKIHQELIERGFKVLNITNEYDMVNKYKLILSAKCLLNIHAYDGESMFEFARCSVPVYNSMNVISEKSLIQNEQNNLTNDYVLDHIIFCDYDDVIEMAIKNLERKINVDYSYLEKISRYEIQRINRELSKIK